MTSNTTIYVFTDVNMFVNVLLIIVINATFLYMYIFNISRRLKWEKIQQKKYS